MFALEKLVRAVEKVIDRDHFHLIEKRDGPDYVSVTWQGTGYDVLHILDHTLTVTLERTQVHSHTVDSLARMMSTYLATYVPAVREIERHDP